MTESTNPVLPSDRQSALWQRLKAHLEARLAYLRAKNDSAKLSGDDTAKLRGQIAEVKALLTLGTDAPKIEDIEYKD